MTLWQFSAREIKARPGRAALTLFSVIIGVAAVVSVAISTIATGRAYDQMYQTLTGRAAVEVISKNGQEFDESVVDQLAERSDVLATIPLIQRPTKIYYDVYQPDENGDKVKVTEKRQTNLMGIDPERDKQARDYRLVDGKFFDGTKGVLLEEGFARSIKFKVGDEIRIITTAMSFRQS